MSIRKLNKIIKDSTTGHGGQLKRQIGWLVLERNLAQGLKYIKEDKAENVLDLIKYNHELRISLFSDALIIESVLNNRMSKLCGEKLIQDIDQKYFSSKKKFDTLIKDAKKKFGDKFKEKTMDDYFSEITFGTKVEIIRLLNMVTIKEYFMNNLVVNRKDFFKSLRIVVGLRNKLVHNSFILRKDLLIFKSAQQSSKKDQMHQYDYVFDSFDKLLSIVGARGIKTRIHKICKKHSKFLKFELVEKYERF